MGTGGALEDDGQRVVVVRAYSASLWMTSEVVSVEEEGGERRWR